jgi:hypothetical protein
MLNMFKRMSLHLCCQPLAPATFVPHCSFSWPSIFNTGAFWSIFIWEQGDPFSALIKSPHLPAQKYLEASKCSYLNTVFCIYPSWIHVVKMAYSYLTQLVTPGTTRKYPPLSVSHLIFSTFCSLLWGRRDSIEVWTQGLTLAKQFRYHFSQVPSPFCFSCFSESSQIFAQGWPWTLILLPTISCRAGITDVSYHPACWLR